MKGAIKDYGIPKRTLMRHCPGVSDLGRKRQVFTDELENEIMTTIQRLEREIGIHGGGYDGKCQPFQQSN